MEKSKVSKNGRVRNAQPHSKGLVISDNSGQTTVQTQCETCIFLKVCCQSLTGERFVLTMAHVKTLTLA